jgi:hypothetical protein
MMHVEKAVGSWENRRTKCSMQIFCSKVHGVAQTTTTAAPSQAKRLPYRAHLLFHIGTVQSQVDAENGRGTGRSPPGA